MTADAWIFLATAGAVTAALVVWSTWMSRRQHQLELDRQDRDHRWQERRDERLRSIKRQDDAEYLAALRRTVQMQRLNATADHLDRIIRDAAVRAGRDIARDLRR